MDRISKKLLSILLCIAVLLSTVVITGMISATGDEEYLSPYPVYSDIDFSKYTVKGGASGNSYTGKYSDGSSAVYWKEVIDETADGGKYIRYDTTNVVEGETAGASTWLGNHAFCPSETGERVVLPVNTTFRITYTIRTDAVEHGINGFVSFVDTPGSLNSVASGTVTWSSQHLAPSKEWTEYSFTFKTPETEKAFYAGFHALDAEGASVKVGYSYDIDHVKLEIVNDANTRVVDFSNYNVVYSGMWGPSEGENTGITDRWAHIYDDDTLSGGKYYNYYGRVIEGNKGINTWYGHYGIAPTVEGSASTSGDMTDVNNVVLPTSTTYRLTVRMRVNEVSGTTTLYRAFTKGQTTQGDATAIATLSKTDGYVTYTDVFSTPEAYNVVSGSTYDRFYISVYNEAAGDMNFDIDYIKLEKIATVELTFDANGGSFSGESTVTEPAVVGDAPEPAATLTAPDKYYALVGWSTSADSAEVVTAVTEAMAGTTLYAVWTRDAHAGGYENVTTVIDFSEFTPSSANSFNFDDGQGNTKRLFWTKNPEADATTEDGNYLRYEALNGKGTNWMGNHALALSKTGAKEALPTGTTYEVTMRVRGNTLPAGGMYPWYAFCDNLRGYSSGDYIKDAQYTTFTDQKVYATGEWTEVKFVFTTPDTYAYNSVAGATFDKFFIGFYTGTSGVNYCYDLDTVTLKKVSTTDFYVDSEGDGTYELYSSATGAPGTDLPMPEAEELKEVYNSDATGYVETYKFDKWYADEARTSDAILKFGNFDVSLYCSPSVSSTSSEGQVGFAGFDRYFELASGMCINPDNAAITTDDAYSGSSSLKLSLSAGVSSAFEIKNNDSFNIALGQSYKVSFKYKAEKDFKAGVVTGEVGNVAGGKNLYGADPMTLSATDTWQTATVIVSADSPIDYARGVALAMVAGSTEANTVYIDAITVSTVTDAITAVKTDNGIRYMMSYNCVGDNIILLEGEEYTIVERGVIVSGADNEIALTLENAGRNGVMQVSQTDLTKYFARNSATGVTTYSVFLDGVEGDDTYEFTARGYVKFSNGDVYYSGYVTSSAADAEQAFVFNIPEEAILKGTHATYGAYESTAYDDSNESYYTYLPAGTIIYSDKRYSVERWGGPGSSWINPNFNGSGTYVMEVPAYCELTIYDGGSLNSDLKITIPPESAHLAKAGFPEDFAVSGVMQRFEAVNDSAVNYVFISDLHTGAFLVKDETNTYWTGYEAESAVLSREAFLIQRLTDIVDFANNNDDIDFICIGGDLVNGYETEFSPMYKAALEAGTVSNVREFIILQIQTMLAPLKNSTKPVFVLMGNHDSNEGQSQFYNDYNKQYGITGGYSINDAEIISDRDWLNGVMKEFINVEIVQDSNYKDTNGDLLSKYYYYDFEKNGVDNRVICLDDVDTRHIFDAETGEITERTSGRRMVYTVEQLQFVADALETAEGNVVFMSHQGIDGATEGAGNGDVLRALISAYQNKTAYVNEAFGINVDFSSGSSGRAIVFHHGHTHENNEYYTDGANIWQLNSEMGRSNFDIVSATEEVIKRYNYAGKDKTYIMPELP